LRVGRNGVLLDSAGRPIGVGISRGGFLQGLDGGRLSMNDVVEAEVGGREFRLGNDGTLLRPDGRQTGIRLGNDGSVFSPNGAPIGLFLDRNGALLSPEGFPIGSLARSRGRLGSPYAGAGSPYAGAGSPYAGAGSPYFPAEVPVNSIRRDRSNRIITANGEQTRVQLGNGNSLLGVNGEPLGFFLGMNGELLDQNGVPMLANGFRTNGDDVLIGSSGSPLGMRLGDNGTLLGLDGSPLGVQLGPNGTLATSDGYPVAVPVPPYPQGDPSYPPNQQLPPAGMVVDPYSGYPMMAADPYSGYPPMNDPYSGNPYAANPYAGYPQNAGMVERVGTGTGRVMNTLRNVRGGIRTLMVGPDYMTGHPAPIPETYTTKGPRDFFNPNPPKIGP
jgi:hypothetical protein